MDEQKIYEISTYGSAMAPFLHSAGLWVGGLYNCCISQENKGKGTLTIVKSIFGKVNSAYISFWQDIPAFLVIGQIQIIL